MDASTEKTGAFSGVTWYHWTVVLVVAAAWAFDCMDGRLFILARESALKDLLIDLEVLDHASTRQIQRQQVEVGGIGTDDTIPVGEPLS